MTAPDGTGELRGQPGPSSAALEVRSAGEVAPEESGGEPGIPVVTDDGAGTADGPDHARRKRRRRTSLIVAVAIVVAAAAGLAATGVLGGDGSDTASDAPSGPAATAKIQRTTLTSTETVDGTLGYGAETTVRAPAGSSSDSGQSQPGGGQAGQGAADSGSGASAGIVTWLPEDGTTIERGESVYKVDQEKVPLLYGSTPFYRTLQDGSEGSDVKMLEENLSKLGYDGFTVDDEYTSTTAAAVEEWQEDLDREETGKVEAGDAVVADGARRVDKTLLSPGDGLSGDILTWTGTERLITVDLDVQYEDSVKEGTTATVTLPDDTSVTAVVSDVGTPSTPSDDSSDKESKTATLPVELTVKDQKKLGRYQAASVDVELKDETRKDVLAVPINALLANSKGGYVIEVVTADGTEYRPVELGMFADNMVEVSGKGITEGLVVGVPE
ncbi:peptidoglycan-binding protein [Streptomyces sp. NPDC005876]|uniref:peptidoglycan-binding protein n=1 Tax=Streptomyces sp. NPDC005876 TaxID=3157076 RepID=UPI00340A1D6D